MMKRKNIIQTIQIDKNKYWELYELEDVDENGEFEV